MQFTNEEVLQPRAISAVKSKKDSSKWLILSAGKSAFFDAGEYAGILQDAISKRDNRAVSVESSDIIFDSLISIRKLVRLIQRFDSIKLFYSGAVSCSKSILPAAIIARFFGKGATLFYYPDQLVAKIPFTHLKTMSLCSIVYVATRYLQRELARQNVMSEVMLPPVSVEALPLRTITEVQPHILLFHESAVDSGAVCAMRAFIMVKHKYPRTILTVITSETIRWQMGIMQLGRNISGHDYKYPNNHSEIISAFAGADVFLNCSPIETAPSALLAAMAAGIPAISFDTYGAREIIEDGINGLLIRHFDHNQLAGQIIRLIEEPALVENISTEAVKIRTRLSIDIVSRHSQ